MGSLQIHMDKKEKALPSPDEETEEESEEESPMEERGFMSKVKVSNDP